MPWPFGLGFGVVGFALLRWGAPMMAPKVPNQFLGGLLASSMLDVLAWAILFIGLAGFVLSLLRTSNRKQLLASQTGLQSIRELDWRQFERLVGEAYRRRGYSIEESGQGGPDGGVDLLLRKDGELTLVQCKHWRARQIGVSTIREMAGLMAHHGAQAGKIVCTGVFSSDCYRFSVGKPIELVDGPGLAKLIAGINRSELGAIPAGPAPSAPPPCPKCSLQMVQRSNRTTGEIFWGCRDYPRCRGTLPFRAGNA